MSELNEDRLHTSVCVCICVCPGMYVFFGHSPVMYISGSSGADVPVCLSALNFKTSLFILLGKIKVDQSKIF